MPLSGHFGSATLALLCLKDSAIQATPDVGFFIARRDDDGDARRLFARWRRFIETRQKTALLDRAQDQPRHDRKP
jgi:hypothetical protein